jgi:imidazolonepropionase-like amidohydrolase
VIASGTVFSYGVDPGAPEMSQGEIAAADVGAIEAGRYGNLIAVQGDPRGLVFKLGNPPN